MMAISVTNKMPQTIIFIRTDCSDFLLIYHVLGLIPFRTNTICAERPTQTIFVISSKVAPNAAENSPVPIIRPAVAAGGRRATATITPTSAEETPDDRDKTAAAPDAKANIMAL